MHRTSILTALLLFVSLGLVACAGSPTVVVVPASFDFGEISAAAPVSGTLSIRNEGNGPLRIESLRTSCSCTTAEVADTTVAAQAETTLTITFDPLVHEGLYGPLLRMVYVESNDPDTPELEIPVHITILSPEEATQ